MWFGLPVEQGHGDGFLSSTFPSNMKTRSDCWSQMQPPNGSRDTHRTTAKGLMTFKQRNSKLEHMGRSDTEEDRNDLNKRKSCASLNRADWDKCRKSVIRYIRGQSWEEQMNCAFRVMQVRREWTALSRTLFSVATSVCPQTTYMVHPPASTKANKILSHQVRPLPWSLMLWSLMLWSLMSWSLI